MGYQYVYGDSSLCTGCKLCMLVCSFVKDGVFRISASRIFVDRRELVDVPQTCRQCDDAPCMSVCPESALIRNATTGAIEVIDEKCTGCSACVEVCPYGVITLHPEYNVAIKCDLCGGDPECIKICPFKALSLKEYVPEKIVQSS